MKFSIVIITRNEEKTLPKLMESLKDFRDRGGEICITDTGSTDKTVEIARSYGCKVEEVGERFITTIDKKTAKELNDRFVFYGEEDIVKAGNRLFDFASARNYATSLATNDMICTLDADEAYTKFNIDKINSLIDEGYEQFEYQFVYAHDPMGRPAVQFVQSKFFDRRVVHWTGVVHEVLETKDLHETKRLLLDESVIKLEHFQEPGGEHRGNYLIGLALDCYQNPTKDRQSHYLAREMFWTNRPKSALCEFERHITMNGWIAERAQSMIFMGHCHGKLNNPEKQIAWYNQAFYVDPNRREALIAIADFYKHNNNHKACAAYAAAALEIPWTDYYANNKSHYENYPHELLYWAKGWLGDIPGAQHHILKALDYQPLNPKYLADTKFYFEYPDNGIEGWMTFIELQFLNSLSKSFETICEVGSFKGRSTHALLSGNAHITAVDHFEGSEDEKDGTHGAKGVYEQFLENTKGFENLTIKKMSSFEAEKSIPFSEKYDVVFIDAGHTYQEVKDDINTWRSHTAEVICGHDYSDAWPEVKQAVDEMFGKPDGVVGTIWFVDLTKR